MVFLIINNQSMFLSPRTSWRLLMAQYKVDLFVTCWLWNARVVCKLCCVANKWTFSGGNIQGCQVGLHQQSCLGWVGKQQEVYVRMSGGDSQESCVGQPDQFIRVGGEADYSLIQKRVNVVNQQTCTTLFGFHYNYSCRSIGYWG